MPVANAIVKTAAPDQAVGLDLGLKDTVATSDGEKLEAGGMFCQRNLELGQGTSADS